jgi:CBS domain-containing protein
MQGCPGFKSPTGPMPLSSARALTELNGSTQCFYKSSRAPSSVKPEPCADLIVVLSAGGLWGRIVAIGEAKMTVKTILSNKGSNVTTTEPAATLESGMKILAEHGIGAVVVLGADQRVIGVLSERDIVRALAERGASALTEPLARVMTRNISTCSPSDTVKSIMRQMTACKFRHLPVVEQEQLVGIVSIGDVVKHTLTELRDESEALHDYIHTA